MKCYFFHWCPPELKIFKDLCLNRYLIHINKCYVLSVVLRCLILTPVMAFSASPAWVGFLQSLGALCCAEAADDA